MPPSAPNALDVRPLPPPRKAATVLATFDRLDAGESFVLVDDRDPDAVCACLAAERPDQGRWTYLRDGPYVWHVRIERHRASG
ncbi:MAG: DUF2249 domain-containing protein [Salinibacter sp.]